MKLVLPSAMANYPPARFRALQARFVEKGSLLLHSERRL